MGARAIIDVDDDTDRCARFWSPWASPHYQIAHLARFVHDTDAADDPVTLVGYRAWVADHLGTLPAVEVDPPAGADDRGPRDDLDYRYRLHLTAESGGVLYTVSERSRRGRTSRWRTTHTLSTRGELYLAAADMCQELARRTQRYAERNNGVGLPGFPSPDEWRTEAATFTAWHDAHDLTGRDDTAVA